MKYIVLTLLLLTSCGSDTFIIKGVPGPQGEQGLKGDKGDTGDAGQDGSGCSVFPIHVGDDVLPNGGAIVYCGDSSVVIHNGSNGTDGEDAPTTAYSIVDIVDPCGDAPGIHDEVFIKLANGQLLWLLVDNASGLNARLALSVPGTWITTDGSNCHFTINNNGEIE